MTRRMLRLLGIGLLLSGLHAAVAAAVPELPVPRERAASAIGYWLAAALIRAAGVSRRLRMADVTALLASPLGSRVIDSNRFVERM